MKIKNLLNAFFIPFIIVLLWETVSLLGLLNPLFLPNPIDVLWALIGLLTEPLFYLDISMTLYRVIVAFVVSILIGIPLGMLMGYSKKIYDSLEFMVEFFRSIPATALFPLFMLFFGVDDLSKIASAVFGASLIILVNTMVGVKFANKLRIKSAKIYKAKGIRLFRHVIFPEALPEIMAGTKLGFSITFIIIILVEMFIGTNFGLGQRIINSQYVYEISAMYATIFVAGIIGFMGNKLLNISEKRLLHYSGK